MRILIATDAWQPQINGVVRTLNALAQAAAPLGATIVFLTPSQFPTVALPFYWEIRLALPHPRAVAARIAEARVDAVHIATEGPIGYMVRSACLEHGIPFTTSFHTRFPDYLAARMPIPERWMQAGVWAWLRRFHAPASTVMAATPALVRELGERGFRNVGLWSRGVDTNLFRPQPDVDLGLPRPVFLTAGRLAPEKNLGAFLGLDLPGPRLWSGTDLRVYLCGGAIRRHAFSVCAVAKRWPRPMPPPMCSSFPAALTPTDWSCWRRWRAAFRSLHSRFPVRAT